MFDDPFFLMPGQDNFIVSLDIGSSSVRALLFDDAGRFCEGFREQLTYAMTTTSDGGVEADAFQLVDFTCRCISALCQKMEQAGIRPRAVATSAFWHSFLGVNVSGDPVTPLLHLFDTRARQDAGQLERELDGRRVHQHTGCRIHSSYWPAKLRWLARTQPNAFQSAARWMSFPEYLLLKLCGEPASSVSMASGSGIWNLEGQDYDEEVLGVLPLSRETLWPAERMDEAQTTLLAPFAQQWPALNGIPWFPAFGDGACSNIGAGCVTPDDFCLMVGTSGAMRAVTGANRLEIPEGLWCYRVDRTRYILGGALTNGGDVYAWMRRNLNVPADAEAQIEKRPTGAHGLTMLPFFGGERSPYWRADLRGVIAGLGLSSNPVDILQAALEGVALSFAGIFTPMKASLGIPKRVVASGGALQQSRVWTQMMADALDVPLTVGPEKEASARGATLLALERLGIAAPPAEEGTVSLPRPESVAAFERLRTEREDLYSKMYKEN